MFHVKQPSAPRSAPLVPRGPFLGLDVSAFPTRGPTPQPSERTSDPRPSQPPAAEIRPQTVSAVVARLAHTTTIPCDGTDFSTTPVAQSRARAVVRTPRSTTTTRVRVPSSGDGTSQTRPPVPPHRAMAE